MNDKESEQDLQLSAELARQRLQQRSASSESLARRLVDDARDVQGVERRVLSKATIAGGGG